jgi:hypothetical protein
MNSWTRLTSVAVEALVQALRDHLGRAGMEPLVERWLTFGPT